MGILSDFTVIDCSIAMAGPFAAQRLGDLGADVIKVEPVSGEWQRARAAGGAQGNRINVSFLSLNRNKRSLAIDLKSPDGKAALLKLVATADVFIQNYRPGVAQRLGVDYDSLKAINPGLVYVSISGYGETGPYVDRPGQDLLLQAMSGAMLSAGREGEPPLPAGQFLADAVTAYNAFEGARSFRSTCWTRLSPSRCRSSRYLLSARRLRPARPSPTHTATSVRRMVYSLRRTASLSWPSPISRSWES